VVYDAPINLLHVFAAGAAVGLLMYGYTLCPTLQADPFEPKNLDAKKYYVGQSPFTVIAEILFNAGLGGFLHYIMPNRLENKPAPTRTPFTTLWQEPIVAPAVDPAHLPNTFIVNRQGRLLQSD
jgi:hypothetical protein